MFDVIWDYGIRIYLYMIPVAAVIIYMTQDFTKVKATFIVKVETLVLVSILWPLILMYMIKQIIWRKRKI